MNRFVIVFLLLATSCSRESDHEKFKLIADQVKVLLLEEMPDAKSIDTLYIFIKNGTEFSKNTIQWAEYQWAATVAKKNGSPDSTILQMQADGFIEENESLDTTITLFYIVASVSVFSKRNLEKGIALKRHYFDKSYKNLPKYSFTRKIADEDNEKVKIENYLPFSIDEFHPFDANFILKYY